MGHKLRLEKVRDALAKKNLDAFLVTSLANIFYLSGFTGSTAIILVLPDTSLFLTDFRYREQFYEEVSEGFELVDFYHESLGKKLKELAGLHNFRRLGVEAEHLSYALVGEIQENAPDIQVSPVSSLVEELREVKEDKELSLILEAIRIAEKVFEELVSILRPGVTELDIAAEFEYRIRKKGVKRASFSPIVAFGPNSAKPHAGYSNQELVPGVPLIFDLGVSHKGYCSDLTRTVFYGGCPEGWARLYAIVREAKELAGSRGKSGLYCHELDRIARTVIEAEGYGDAFGHGLGHGVGIEVHEAPRISKTSSQILREGSIITIEPGIYLSKQGGIRIEDMYLVKKNGLERLNKLSTELMVIT